MRRRSTGRSRRLIRHTLDAYNSANILDIGIPQIRIFSLTIQQQFRHIKLNPQSASTRCALWVIINRLFPIMYLASLWTARNHSNLMFTVPPYWSRCAQKGWAEGPLRSVVLTLFLTAGMTFSREMPVSGRV